MISAIANAGAVGIWTNGAAMFSEAVSVCSAALDDPSAAVRAAFAAALGKLAAAAKSDAAQVLLSCYAATWMTQQGIFWCARAVGGGYEIIIVINKGYAT